MLRHVTANCDDISAEVRAVHAFLLDPEIACGLENEDLASSNVISSSMLRRDTSTVSANKSAVHVHISKPRKINHSRERMKHELLTLRQQVIALEARRRTLRQGEAVVESSENVMQLAWRTVALDQRQQRTDGERLQKLLRTRIKSNKLAMYRLQQLLRKTKVHTSIKSPLIAVKTQDPNIEARYLQVAHRLETMYMEIQTVFENVQLGQVIDSFHNLRIDNDMTREFEVEVRDSYVLPFNTVLTANAIWIERHRRMSISTPNANKLFHRSDTVIRRHFEMSVQLPFYDGRIRGVSEARRYTRGKEQIIMYCALATTSDFVQVTSSGDLAFLLSSWTRVGPRQMPGKGPQDSLSQIETVERVRPLLPVSVNGISSTALRELRDFCVEGIMYHGAERQTVENMLIDLTVQKTRTSAK